MLIRGYFNVFVNSPFYFFLIKAANLTMPFIVKQEEEIEQVLPKQATIYSHKIMICLVLSYNLQVLSAWGKKTS